MLRIDYFSHNKIIDDEGLQIEIKNTDPFPNHDYALEPHLANLPEEKRQRILSKLTDKSDWIASITALNGVLNGTSGVHALDMYADTLKCELWSSKKGKSTWMSGSYDKWLAMQIINDNFKTPSLTSN